MRFLEAPTLNLTEFQNHDQVVAYRVPKDAEKTLVFVFMHQRMEEQVQKAFGVPLTGSISGDDIKGSKVRDLYFKLLDRFITKQGAVHHQDNSGSQDFVAEGTNADSDMEFEFYTTDEKGEVKDSKLEMTEAIKENPPNRFYVNVRWPKKWSELHSNAFEIISPLLLRCGSAETLPLYRCLERYLEEETVSSWDCSQCNKKHEALKKLNLCRLPEIFVIHLLRFIDTESGRIKMEDFVDFPADLDMAPYITNSSRHLSSSYMLYAVINHRGSLEFGHVTAFVHHDDGKWYKFDDNKVSSISEWKIKTEAAYVLFYRRVPEG